MQHNITPAPSSGSQSAVASGTSPAANTRRIRNAIRIVAKLLEDDTAYLPIFQRLELDLKAAEEQEHALERAMRWVGRD